jgi:S-disulfanyl-L-cysteine oxidoreductase SoxD
MAPVILKPLSLAAIVLALVASNVALKAGGSGLSQQEPIAPVFSAEQAAAGKLAFGKACAGCHMADLSGQDDAPPLAGAPFASSWRTRTTKDLLDYMSTAMPPGGSSLAPEDYASIVAYVLQINGAVAGAQALSASTGVPIGSVITHRTPTAVPRSESVK